MMLCVFTTSAQEIKLLSTKNNVELSIVDNKITINRNIKGPVNMFTDDGRQWLFYSVEKLKTRPNRVKGMLKHMSISKLLYMEYNDRMVSFDLRRIVGGMNFVPTDRNRKRYVVLRAKINIDGK